jgi:hypothetical protein
MAVEHNVPVSVTRGVDLENPSFDATVARLAELASQPRSALVIEMSGAVEHWTVIQRVSRHFLQISIAAGCSA